MIIDAHCHAGRGDGFTGPWDTEATLDSYLARADAAGIGHTIAFPVFASDYAVANAGLARIVAALPHRLTGFCALHPQRDHNRLPVMVGRAVETYGFRGIKIHGIEAYPSRLSCALAARYRLPILFDVFRRPERIELLAGQYPEVNFIVPHLGSFADDWTKFRVVIDQLVRHPNVFADTSGVRYFDALTEAACRAPEKLIFGSDGPLLHPGVELAKVQQLGLRPDLRRMVLGGRIAQLTGLEHLLRGQRRPHINGTTPEPTPTTPGFPPTPPRLSRSDPLVRDGAAPAIRIRLPRRSRHQGQPRVREGNTAHQRDTAAGQPG